MTDALPPLRKAPDIHVHNDPYPVQFGSGDWITVVSRATGTFTGEMKLPNGKAPRAAFQRALMLL